MKLPVVMLVAICLVSKAYSGNIKRYSRNDLYQNEGLPHPKVLVLRLKICPMLRHKKDENKILNYTEINFKRTSHSLKFVVCISSMNFIGGTRLCCFLQKSEVSQSVGKTLCYAVIHVIV